MDKIIEMFKMQVALCIDQINLQKQVGNTVMEAFYTSRKNTLEEVVWILERFEGVNR